VAAKVVKVSTTEADRTKTRAARKTGSADYAASIKAGDTIAVHCGDNDTEGFEFWLGKALPLSEDAEEEGCVFTVPLREGSDDTRELIEVRWFDRSKPTKDPLEFKLTTETQRLDVNTLIVPPKAARGGGYVAPTFVQTGTRFRLSKASAEAITGAKW